MVKAAESSTHWGEWIKRRAAVVGIIRMQELCDTVGCGRTQMCKWIGSPNPPHQMRKGLDLSLALALKTDRATLFNGYTKTLPNAVPIDVSPEPTDSLNSTRRRLLAIVELMPPTALKDLTQAAERLLCAAMHAA